MKNSVLLLDEITPEAQSALIEGARDTRPVNGLTHNFYRYPARFSPAFVRAAIKTFTDPGDYILDPHVGGGTSLVEALALGRNGIGVDISELAEFVSTVKTAVFEDRELRTLAVWADRLSEQINIHRPSARFDEYAERGYYKHLNSPLRWRLRKAIEQALDSATRLGSTKLEAFARCAVLRTAQWALDGRKKLPSIPDFRSMLVANAFDMIDAARCFRQAVSSNAEPPSARILNRSAAGLEEDQRIAGLPPPRLVVTSPPYPGIHVLYHRWQVDGRKEAPLPFMIANKLDGASSSYYTMGDRKYPELATYFANIAATMASAAAIAAERTVFVQMVAFSDPSWQLPRYLETMEQLGLSEAFLPVLRDSPDGRLWRSVPNRRWYSDQRGDTPGSKEVVLIHKKLPAARRPLPGRRDRSDRPPRRPNHLSFGLSG